MQERWDWVKSSGKKEKYDMMIQYQDKNFLQIF